MKTITVDVAIIGAGTAGLYALREVRRAGKSFALIDSGPLGTTCARVGCMPSKVALHAGELWSVRHEQETFGVLVTGNLSIDRQQAWKKVRQMRDGFASRAADNARKAAGEHLLMGRARFIEPTLLAVRTDQGKTRIRAQAVVIANGSRPVLPGFLKPFSDHCLTTDDLFELDVLPTRLGILGLGAIGLEMGLALSRLGVQVVGADMAESIGGIRDPEVADHALDSLGKQFPMHLGSPARLEAANQDKGVILQTDTKAIPVDKVLVALGRRSNVDSLDLAGAGFALDDHGMPAFDPRTMQIGNLPVYIAGDANGARTLMHEAAEEGAMAGFNAAHTGSQAFERKVPLAIAFTQPDIIAVGASFDALDHQGVVIGRAFTDANGRSRILGTDPGILRIYIDRNNGRIQGASMVGPRAEHVAQLMAVAIQQGLTAHQLMQGPYYHPVVEEMVQSALQDALRQMPATDTPLGLVPAAAEPGAPFLTQ